MIINNYILIFSTVLKCLQHLHFITFLFGSHDGHLIKMSNQHTDTMLKHNAMPLMISGREYPLTSLLECITENVDHQSKDIISAF